MALAGAAVSDILNYAYVTRVLEWTLKLYAGLVQAREIKCE